MRFLRPPYRFLIAWTLVCLVPTAALVRVVTRVRAPGTCFEWCDLDVLLGNAAISLIAVTWLVVTLLSVWGWNRTKHRSGGHRARARELAGFGAILSGAVMLGSFALGATGNPVAFAQAWVVALGLQLVASGELAAWARPRSVAVVALLLMVLATLATGAFLVYGTHVYSPFWWAMQYAYGAFLAGLLLLIARAWLQPIPGRPALLLLAVGALWEIWIVVYQQLKVFRLEAIDNNTGTGLLALAVGWVLFGMVTLLRGSAQPPAAPVEGSALNAVTAVQRSRTPPPFPRF
jgi:hypothetical protein